MVVLTAALSYAALPLTRRRLTTRRAVALVAVLQVVVHVAHTLLAARVTPATLAVPDVHAHGGHALAGAVPAAGLALAPSPGMTAAHVAAALVVGWALARGEAAAVLAGAVFTGSRLALRRWVDGCTGAAALLADARSAPLVTSPLRSRRRRQRAPRSVWLAPAAARRGPPALLGA